MDRILGLGTSCRTYRVLGPAVPRWPAAKPSLAMVRLAQLDPDINGSNFRSVHSWVDSWSWTHQQPSRSRGLAKCLEAGSDVHAYSHIRFSSFPVYAAAPGERSRAPADQMVHLYWCGCV